MDVISLHQKSDKYTLSTVICSKWALLEGQYFQTVPLSLNKGELDVHVTTLGIHWDISEVSEIAQ